MAFFVLVLVSVAAMVNADYHRVSYSGHQVISVQPKTKEDLDYLWGLESKDVDLWNEPVTLDRRVMMRLKPDSANEVKEQLKKRKMEFETSFDDLGKVIDKERKSHIQEFLALKEKGFDFSKYHNLPEIYNLMEDLATHYSGIAKLGSIGMSYENRPINSIKIGEGQGKPLVILEYGIHPREWPSVAAGTYMMNKLVTEYGNNDEVTQLVKKFEFLIIPVANPDGYFHTHTVERLWRKTMSPQKNNCIGVDPNRNFDVEHCKLRSTKDPCSEIFCGEEPFSESETRAIRDLMHKEKDRIAVYFSVHNFMQLWMYPYGFKKEKPDNAEELHRVGEIGVKALAEKYGTRFRLGNIADVIYPVSGNTIDYAHANAGIKMAYALELRDQGIYGFLLPEELILPTCEETYDGIVAAINALK